MWADTLLAGEHLLAIRLLAWGALSVLTGTGLIAWVRAEGRHSPLLHYFGLQTSLWGAAEIIAALILLGDSAPRDLSAALRLDRLLWLSIGLDLGFVLIGLVLLLSMLRPYRRLGPMGAGLAIMVQGTALLVLDLLLAALISR